MIPDWFTKKKLTFMMIPEANRQVRRLQIPVFWVYFVPSAIVLMIAAVLVLSSLQGALWRTNSALHKESQLQTAAHKQQIAVKEAEIAKLQDEVVRLSQEAENFAVKMTELQALEREILSLTEEGGVSGEKERPVAEAGTSKRPASVTVLSAGVGGQYVPLEPEDALRLSASTYSSYKDLAAEAERLGTSLEAALAEAEKIAYLRSITPSIYPTISTHITSGFGFRRDPFTKKSASHNGIDFGGSVGDPVFATAAGTVSRTGYDRAMGNYIFVKHGNNLETVYMHLSKTLVKKGQTVKKGEKIGSLGSTGRSTGPHLHYEVHKNGTPINPKPYIKEQEG